MLLVWNEGEFKLRLISEGEYWELLLARNASLSADAPSMGLIWRLSRDQPRRRAALLMPPLRFESRPLREAHDRARLLALLLRRATPPDRAAVDHNPRAIGGNRHSLTVGDLASQDHFGERVLHFLLDDALQWTRAVGRIVALVRTPGAALRIEL